MPVAQIHHFPGAIDAVFALLGKNRWVKLPHLSVLLLDPDAKVLLLPPYSLTRSQIQYQFVYWRRIGGPASAAASSLDDAQIITTVDNRVGSVSMLLRRTFAAVALGPLVGRRPSFMPGVLQALETNQDCKSFLISRVLELKGFVVGNFARRASNVRSNSLAFETAIIDSRSQHKEEWVGQTRPA